MDKLQSVPNVVLPQASKALIQTCLSNYPLTVLAFLISCYHVLNLPQNVILPFQHTSTICFSSKILLSAGRYFIDKENLLKSISDSFIQSTNMYEALSTCQPLHTGRARTKINKSSDTKSSIFTEFTFWWEKHVIIR